MSSDTVVTPHQCVTSPDLQAILDEVCAALHSIYGDRFPGLVLFGSQARGTAVRGSDIDLLPLLQR